jgi:myxalamid-type nonribosomal peptide synthetase MxaA
MNNLPQGMANLSPEEKRELLARLLQQGARDGSSNLSIQQQRSWLLYQLETIPTHVFAAFDLRGPLDLPAFQRSVRAIVERHDILRTTFVELEGRPLATVAQSAQVNVPLVNISDFPPADRETEVYRLALRDAQQPFNLNSAPLMRVTLVRLEAEAHVLLVTLHQIIGDDWSVDLLVREIARLYEEFAAQEPHPENVQLPALSLHYTDFAKWQAQWLQSDEQSRQLAYWREQLAYLPVLELPTDRPRPALRTQRGTTRAFDLPADLVRRLQALSERENVPLATTLLAAFKVLLARYSRQQDLAVGVPTPNRLHSEWEGVLGPFSNTLVLRSDLSADPLFTELLQRVEQSIRAAHAHQDLPFERLVDELQPQRDLSHTPLFQVMFTMRDPEQSLRAGPLTITGREVDAGTTLYDLTLIATPKQDGLRMQIQFNVDLFDIATIERLGGHFRVLLAGIADDPARRLSQLPLLPEAELHLMLTEWNQNRRPYRRDLCMHQIVEEQVERAPDSIAVVFNDRQMTYRELNTRANQLAHYLRAQGVGPETLVGVAAEFSPETIVELLAVLKAGGAYVPMDPAYPPERLRFIIEDSQVAFLLTQKHLLRRLPVEGVNVISLDAEWTLVADQPTTNPQNITTSDHLAYVIYTSGSTGKPKGTLVPHRQIVHSTSARFVLDQSAVFTYLLLPSFSFDASAIIYWSFIQAGRLVLPTSEQMQDPRLLRQLIKKEWITHMACVPSHYTLLLEADAHLMRSLRYVIVGGEVCSPHLVAQHHRLLSGTRLINDYGPTEATIWSSAFECFEEHSRNTSIPIGKPIANAQLYLLDEYLNPVPIGVAGELHIGGHGVTRGYLNRPALTAERFIPDPFGPEEGGRLYKTGDLARFLPDGNIDFLGRIDNQVKVRGFRIELGEIETALLHHPDVDEAFVMAREDQPGNKRLVGYVVPREGVDLNHEILSSFLVETLPHYMVPQAFVFLEALPLTPNRKVDQKALPAPEEQSSDANFVAPRTMLEAEIAQAFVSVIGIDRISIHDNFFEIGGNSLMIARLAARLSSTYAIDLPVHQIFKVPTVAGVARVIDLYQNGGHAGLMAAWTVEQMEAEARLDPSISPEGLPVTEYLNPRRVLLTGSTGYLGSFILESLLRDTSAEIFCLVRASTPEKGLERIKKNMQFYRIWNEAYRERIRPVVGDLAKPLLGLSEEQFEELAATIDTIYHSGALVNFVYPYATLKAPNVLGTQEVLRLACTTTLKGVHYISTIDVLLATHTPRPFLEDAPLKPPREVPEGYPLSKLVAEKVVSIGRERGIPISIYRPGLIMSHTQTGATQTSDYMLVTLKGYLQLGMLPVEPLPLDIVPVDFTARAIVHISRQASSVGKTFHMWNLERVPMSQIYEWIKSFGYKFDVVEPGVVKERVLAVDPSHPLYPLTPILRMEEERDERFDPDMLENVDPRDECRNVIEGLAGSGLEFPPLDERLAHLCFAYLVEVGFLEPPSVQREQLENEVAA